MIRETKPQSQEAIYGGPESHDNPGRVTITPAILPFTRASGAFQRIEILEHENDHVVALMHRLCAEFRAAFKRPWPIYLSVQSVRSGTVYVRWRRQFPEKQTYLQFASAEAMRLLNQLPKTARDVLADFDRRARLLTLAHSLRHREIRRLREFIRSEEAIHFD